MVQKSGWIEKNSYYVDKIARIFVVILTAILVVDVLIGVANRFIFHLALSWTEEIARYLFIWIIMMGAGIVLRLRGHIGLTFILKRLKKSKNWVILVTQIMMLFFLLTVIVYGIKLFIFILQKGQVSPASGIPLWLLFLSIPLGSSIMVIHLLSQIESTFRGFSNIKFEKEHKHK